MPTDAAITSFAIVFTVFLVVTGILLVLVLRFILQRAAIARRAWLAEQATEEEEPPITALVLAGGGIRGAVQIGMLQVLAEHGFVPDRIYGSSVGAINGAAFAGDPTRSGVEQMTEIWLGLSRDHVYPQGRLHGPWMYFQQRDSVYANSGLRKVVEDGISYEHLEDAVVPVEVVATSLTDGREHWFTYGPVAEAVLASAAIPAIFPPVEIDGDRFIDGGVVDNVPIRRAVEAGATRIVVLLCTPPMYLPMPTKRPVEAILNALFISIHNRFARDMTQLPPGVEVIVCSGNEFGTRDFDDFSNTEALINQGRAEASEIVRRYGIGRPGPTTSIEGSADLTLPSSGAIPTNGTPSGTSSPTAPPSGADRSPAAPSISERSGSGQSTSEPPASPTQPPAPLIHPEPGT